MSYLPFGGMIKTKATSFLRIIFGLVGWALAAHAFRV